MNYCTSCRQDFSSVEGFDMHRVGVHAYTFREGLLLDPPVEDGRRCLDVEELAARGFALNRRGAWEHQGRAERARQAFGRAQAAA